MLFFWRHHHGSEVRGDCCNIARLRNRCGGLIAAYVYGAATFMSRHVAICSRLFAAIFRHSRNLAATTRDFDATQTHSANRDYRALSAPSRKGPPD